MKNLFRKILKKIISGITYPFRMTWRGIKAVGRFWKRVGIAIYRSPIATYHKIIYWRDKLLNTVNYLQEESAKWRTTFTILKMPYSFLRMMGLSPQMAIGLLTASSMAGTGVIVNETLLAEKSFANRDPGVYAASVVGQNAPLDIPTEIVEGSNTLRISLTGSALPSGEQNVVQVSGNVVTGGTNTRLEIGHLILENSRCKKLELTDIQAHTILVRGNAADGHSIAPSPGTSRMRAIGG